MIETTKKPKILVVGSLVMDLIVSTPRFPQQGETVLGTDYTTASGGKGANQAVQAARLGAQVDMVGRVGNDAMGQEMLDSLTASGVNTSHILTTQGTPSAIGNVQLEVKGGKTNNRIIVVSGANMKITYEDIAFLESEISQYDMVIMQHEIPLEINQRVLQYAHHKGVKTMLNPAPSAPIRKEILPYITYLAPNEHEVEDITGIAITNEASAKRAVNHLVERGVKNVIITLGSKGAAFGNDHEFFISPSILADHVADPTAAGDSFIGAFCYGVSAGMAEKEAMIFANHAAHITVTRMGAQPSLPTLTEVKTLVEEKNADIGRVLWR